MCTANALLVFKGPRRGGETAGQPHHHHPASLAVPDSHNTQLDVATHCETFLDRTAASQRPRDRGRSRVHNRARSDWAAQTSSRMTRDRFTLKKFEIQYIRSKGQLGKGFQAAQFKMACDERPEMGEIFFSD